MATIQQIQAAVKAAPHYRVTCGALEVIGAPGATRWTFDYIVRRAKTGMNGLPLYAHGKQNAVDYLATLASETPIENVTFRASRGMAEQAAIYAQCVAHVEKRKAMIAANRERAATLRNRAWSDVALDNRAFHAFALCQDKDGNREVMRAANELQTYLRDAPQDITHARAAFRSLYGIARDYARIARKRGA